MKKLILTFLLFFNMSAHADVWSSLETVTEIFIEHDGAFTYTTTGTMENPRGCRLLRYSVPNNHPNRDLLYTHITLAWKNDYMISSRVSSTSCYRRTLFPEIVKVVMTK